MRILYYILLITTSLFWGGNFVAGKFIVDHANAITLTDLRYIIAILIFIPIVWFKERKLIPPKEAWLPIIGMAVFGVILFNLFMFWSIERTSAYNSSLMTALNPVSIAIVAFFAFRERLTLRQISAIIICFIGVMTVVSDGKFSHLLNLTFNFGDILMLLGVLAWGVFSAYGKKAMTYVSPLMSTLWMSIIGVILMLPIDLMFMDVQWGQLDSSFWLSVLYFSVCGTVLAMLFWNMGVKKLGGTHAGIFLNFNPVFTAILAYFFISETVSIVQGIGSIIVAAGVILFTTAKKPESAPASKPAIPTPATAEVSASKE